MTDKKLASIIPELTISDMTVIYMVFCDIIGISNAAFEKERPDDFSRFLKVKKRFEDECRAQMKSSSGGKINPADSAGLRERRAPWIAK